MFLKFTDQNLCSNWRQWHVLVFNLGIQIRNEPAEALHIPYYTGQFFFLINPLSPNIHIQILQTDLNTFP